MKRIRPGSTKAAIRSYLSEHPELRRDSDTVSEHPLAGHCYVASEAFFHLNGGYDRYDVYRIKKSGVTHWFLREIETGDIIDLTAEQFETPVNYENATKTGFLTSEPSKRAQRVISSLEERKVLAVDIDGVLAEQNRPVVEHLNKQYNLDYSLEDIDSRNPEISEIGIDYVDALRECIDADFFRGLELIPGARDALRKLARKYRIIAVTHRKEKYIPATKQWIEMKNLPIDGLIQPAPDDKTEVDCSYDLLIDDYFMNAKDAAEMDGTNGYLFIRHNFHDFLPNQLFNSDVRIVADNRNELSKYASSPRKQWKALTTILNSQDKTVTAVNA